MNITSLKHLIENKFNTNNCGDLIISNKRVKELFNFVYKLNEYSGLPIKNVEPESVEDEIERQRLIEKAKELYKYFEKDLYTRQAVVQMKYNNEPELASCLSLFQFIIRNNKLFLSIFVRSQNYDKNFEYDNNTYSHMYSELFKILLDKNNKLKFGEINVKITSLHRFIES